MSYEWRGGEDRQVSATAVALLGLIFLFFLMVTVIGSDVPETSPDILSRKGVDTELDICEGTRAGQ